MLIQWRIRQNSRNLGRRIVLTSQPRPNRGSRPLDSLVLIYSDRQMWDRGIIPVGVLMIAEQLEVYPTVVCPTAQRQRSKAEGITLLITHMNHLGFLAVFVAMVIATLILLLGSLSLANDGIIDRTAVGGITFRKNNQIRMQEEFLEISAKEVRVKFRFFNDSARDIRATVGFAVPPYDPSGAGILSNISASLKVLVNGHMVSPEFDRRAVLGDYDVTTQLSKVGLSHGQIYGDSLLSKKQASALEKLDGAKREFLPRGYKGWKIVETAFWQQNFPARKEVVIQHTYRPAVGHVPSSIVYEADRGIYDPDLSTQESIPTAQGENDKAVCLDDISRQAIEKKIKDYTKANSTSGNLSICVYLRHIEYVLRTARTWKGPIGKFKLRIKKETQDQIISLCFPGKPKKVSSTVYEFVHKDFVPPDRLIVYFYDIGPFPDAPL